MTNVGTAYVELIVDGSGVNQGIADSLQDVDYKSMAKKHGDEYGSSFKRGVEGQMAGEFSSVKVRLDAAIENTENVNKTIQQVVAKSFDRGHFANLGKHIGRELGLSASENYDIEINAAMLNRFEERLRQAARNGLDLKSILNDKNVFDNMFDGGSFDLLGPDVAAMIKDAERSISQVTKEFDAAHKAADQARAKETAALLAKTRQEERIAAIKAKADQATEDTLQRMIADEEQHNEKMAELKRRTDLAHADRMKRQRELETAHSERQAADLLRLEEQERRNIEAKQEAEDRLDEMKRRTDQAHADRMEAERKRQARHDELKAARQAREDAKKAEQQAKDLRWAQAYAAAREGADNLIGGTYIRPDVDPAQVEALRAKLEADLAKREFAVARLGLDISDAEKAAVEAEIRQLDARINLNLHTARDTGALRGRDSRDFDALSMGTGALLGRGSRNNILNVMGSSVTNLMKLMGSLGKVGFATFKGLGEVGGAVFDGWKQGTGIFDSLTKGVAAGGTQAGAMLASLGSTAAVALPALAAAAAAAVVAMTVLSAVVGALLGLVVSLAGALVGGLAAGAIVAVATLAPLIAAVGLLTAMFTSLTTAQGKWMAETMEPLRDFLAGFGQELFTGFMEPLSNGMTALQTVVTNVTSGLAGLVPYLQSFGAAFAQSFAIISGALMGDGFQKLFQSLGVYLPSIIVNLSTAISGLLNGLSGVFATLMPYVDQFADYLARVATEFADWATSAEGQNSIVDFVERGLDALQSIWNFATSFWDWFVALFLSPQAMAAGGSIFDSLADAFDGFTAGLKGGELEKWFEDAIQFGAALWAVIESVGQTFMDLYNDGTIDALAGAIEGVADAVGWISTAIEGAKASASANWGLIAAPFLALKSTIDTVVAAAQEAVYWIGKALGQDMSGMRADWDAVAGSWQSTAQRISPVDNYAAFAAQAAEQVSRGRASSANGGAPIIGPIIPSANRTGEDPSWSDTIRQNAGAVSDLILGGGKARAETYESAGGHVPDPKKPSTAAPKWVNPYTALANQIIAENDKEGHRLRDAIESIHDRAATELTEASVAKSADAVLTGITRAVEGIRGEADTMVSTLRTELTAAARSLSGASSRGAAKKALKEVRDAQEGLKDALKEQERVEKAAAILEKQGDTRDFRVDRLAKGLKARNATLADYAEARKKVAEQVKDAEKAVQDALKEYEDTQKSVADSARSYGAMSGIKGDVVDGEEQDVTAKNLMDGLAGRLGNINEFTANLTTLQAMGISDEVFQQLTDAGVEAGGEMARALIEGGTGAVQGINSLTAEIGRASEALGTDAAERLHRAGIEAADGLLAGLLSREEQLEIGAAVLGEKVGKAIRRALRQGLKINSPSRAAMEDMGHFGDGLVMGLDAQQGRVGRASDNLAQYINPSPEVSDWEAAQGQGSVSGNDRINGRPINLTVHTPTEDPWAVSREVLSELTGRL